MAFIAAVDSALWDYIHGDSYSGDDYSLSISTTRFYYLQELGWESEDEFKVSCRDPDNDRWTKWARFPGMLLKSYKASWGRERFSHLTAAVDVHRSVLPHEVVVESDYPTYEENYDATRIIGAILENKGFTPHYYYSGSKSVHIHIYFDWACLNSLNDNLKEKLVTMFKGSTTRFKKTFMKWLREKMISCWGTNARQFDTDLVRATHLIRAEMSRNKRGFKTFMGYTYKDLSFVPYICNENNRIYPKVGTRKLSVPNDVNGLVEEFCADRNIKKRTKKVSKKNRSLTEWTTKSEGVRDCVKVLLSDDFIKLDDGKKRALFILVNEFRTVYGDSKARILIQDWVSRLESTVRDEDVESMFKNKQYKLGLNYIHKFLEEFNLTVPTKCNHKV